MYQFTHINFQQQQVPVFKPLNANLMYVCVFLAVTCFTSSDSAVSNALIPHDFLAFCQKPKINRQVLTDASCDVSGH